MKLTEFNVANFLAFHLFKRQYLIFVPNCNYTGNECDMLAVTKDLRIVDFEIKLSKADLKVDQKKDKWFDGYNWGAINKQKLALGRSLTRTELNEYKVRVNIPKRVWKHFIVFPEALWEDSLFDSMSDQSGLLLFNDKRVYLYRKATCNRNVDRLKPENIYDLARLTCLRLFNKRKYK